MISGDMAAVKHIYKLSTLTGYTGRSPKSPGIGLKLTFSSLKNFTAHTYAQTQETKDAEPWAKFAVDSDSKKEGKEKKKSVVV